MGWRTHDRWLNDCWMNICKPKVRYMQSSNTVAATASKLMNLSALVVPKRNASSRAPESRDQHSVPFTFLHQALFTFVMALQGSIEPSLHREASFLERPDQASHCCAFTREHLAFCAGD